MTLNSSVWYARRIAQLPGFQLRGRRHAEALDTSAHNLANCQKPPSRPDEAHKLFQWAAMVVSSRSFCLIDKAGNKFACLAPVADFANHEPYQANATFQLGMTTCSCAYSHANQSNGCPALVLSSSWAVEEGEEITINYGADKSNQLLLEAYGFPVTANVSDRLPLGQPGRWRDFADTSKDLQLLDEVATAVLATAGIHLDTSSSGSLRSRIRSACEFSLPSSACSTCSSSPDAGSRASSGQGPFLHLCLNSGGTSWCQGVLDERRCSHIRSPEHMHALQVN